MYVRTCCTVFITQYLLYGGMHTIGYLDQEDHFYDKVTS